MDKRLVDSEVLGYHRWIRAYEKENPNARYLPQRYLDDLYEQYKRFQESDFAKMAREAEL